MSRYRREELQRIRRRQRMPDYARKAGPIGDREANPEEEDIQEQLEEWETDSTLFEEFYQNRR